MSGPEDTIEGLPVLRAGGAPAKLLDVTVNWMTKSVAAEASPFGAVLVIRPGEKIEVSLSGVVRIWEADHE